jgi:hypothetical protein
MADIAHLPDGPAGHAGSGAAHGISGERAEDDTAALPCGASIDALVDQVDAGQLEPADLHQRGCAHCRRALLQAATAGQALGMLRASHGPVPPTLVDRVLREVRRTRQPAALIEISQRVVRRDRQTEVEVTGGEDAERPGMGSGVAGAVRVHRQVLADLARVAVDGLRGIRVVRASASGRPGRPGALAVSLGLLVDGRTPLPEVARTVRQAVRAALRASTGSTEVQIELTALDLIQPPARTDP